MGIFRWTGILALLAAAFCALTAGMAMGGTADFQANQRPTLVGGRAALLGGAFTGIADDASASYYNPAGLAFASDDGVSVSSTVFRDKELIYDDVVDGESFSFKSSHVFPGFIGGTVTFSPLTVGYSFITVDSDASNQDTRFTGLSTSEGSIDAYTRTAQESSSYILAGGSAGLKLGDHLSFGATVFYYQRRIDALTHQTNGFEGGGYVIRDDTLQTLNTGIAYVSGIMLKLGKFSLGAAVHYPFSLSNKTRLIIDQVDDRDGTATDITTVTSDFKPYREMNPNTYRLGLAYEPLPYLLLAFDAILHEGVKSKYKDEGGHDLHTTANYSAGLEVSMGAISVKGGWFTNVSMYDDPEEGQINGPTKIDYTGTTVGIGWDFDTIQGHLGYIGQTGRGRAQLITDSTAVQDVHAEAKSYVLSGKIPFR